jgi:hypothetical protein
MIKFFLFSTAAQEVRREIFCSIFYFSGRIIFFVGSAVTHRTACNSCNIFKIFIFWIITIIFPENFYWGYPAGIR